MPRNATTAYATTSPTATPKETQAHVFALVEDCLAPTISPAASFPLTWAAYTIETIPNGKQQNMVTNMACTR